MGKAICLRYTGSATEFETSTLIINENISTANFPKGVKRTKGFGNLEKRHDYKLDGKFISVYSWNDGEAGTENKHELPTPLDSELYFGNVYLIGHNLDKTQIDINLSDYENMKNIYFGGIEDIGSDDTWSSDDDTLASDDSLNDFLAPG